MQLAPQIKYGKHSFARCNIVRICLTPEASIEYSQMCFTRLLLHNETRQSGTFSLNSLRNLGFSFPLQLPQISLASIH
jgi:hypothetical protein